MTMVSTGVVALAGCGEGGVPGGSTVEETADLPPFTEAADAGAVELLEASLTWLVNADGREPVAFGLIVENTSTLVATDTQIRVDLVDESGTVVWTSRPLTVWVLAPKQRFGAGAVLMPEAARPVEIRVSVGGSLWYPLDSAGTQFGRLTVTEASLDYPEDCVVSEASFAVESSYVRPLAADVTGVLRDGGGTIIGGTGLQSLPDPVRVAPGVYF
jgi:hypothetical protein